ncbi:hypothetical protein [Paenibacillus beijingensis]|uniref:Uncharacterized protein n=1 Tax=Paenibacillus beijingensis TaxID=1126833 RepID=A0A0D5NJA2_9BACL|nr:hypothetical protein [Paenibacillus beijingensis]AJY75077.1 hypothetical protein VN24_11425 [Paenibacillus beijingensis]
MFEALYIAYLLVCALMIGLRFRRSPREAWVRFSFAAAFPVVGLTLPLFRRRPQRDTDTAQRELQLNELLTAASLDVPSAASIQLHTPETERELNVVSIEEALAINDLPSRRQAVIDMLKTQSLDHLEMLRLAVSNEDTETSHYAASAIMEIKRKLNLTIQALAVQYEENRTDREVLASYAEVLRDYIRSGFLDRQTYLQLRQTYSEVLGHWIDADPQAETAYIEKLDADLEIGDYASAEQTAGRYMERFPEKEEAYLVMIKLYYVLRLPHKLEAALEQLKRSPIRLSNKSITIVRYWSKGG